MKANLIVAVLMMATAPVVAQAQTPNAAKLKADAQKVVDIISGDKAKTQIYCDIGKLSAEVEEADQKKDAKKVDELSQKIDEMEEQLGPEYTALADALQDVDPESEEGQEIGSTLQSLDKLCAK